MEVSHKLPITRTNNVDTDSCSCADFTKVCITGYNNLAFTVLLNFVEPIMWILIVVVVQTLLKFALLGTII